MPLRVRTHIARKLRRDSTDAEKRLWRALHATGTQWKFRRQHPIGQRIVDFACPAGKLVIELDGGQHDERRDADAMRTEEIARYGYRVLWFWNNEVIENLEGIVQVILMELGTGFPTSPQPSPPRRGGEGV